MPPFSNTQHTWELGKCDYNLSPSCVRTCKKNNVMCKACEYVATDQQKEDMKQAYTGEYCNEFGCWEVAVKRFPWCKKCTAARPDAATGAGAASSAASSASAPQGPPTDGAPQAPPPPRGTPPPTLDIDQIVASANADELRDLIILASNRLHGMHAMAVDDDQ